MTNETQQPATKVSSGFLPSLRPSSWMDTLLPFAGLAIVFTTLSILSPHFLTLQNLANVARQTAVINIMALGMTIIIISGGIDLSVGSVMAFSGIAGTMLLQAGLPLPGHHREKRDQLRQWFPGPREKSISRGPVPEGWLRSRGLDSPVDYPERLGRLQEYPR